MNLFVSTRDSGMERVDEIAKNELEDIDAVLLDLLKLPRADCENLDDALVEQIPASRTTRGFGSETHGVQIKTPVATRIGRNKGGKNKKET